MKELKYRTKGETYTTLCPYGRGCSIGAGSCTSCKAFIAENKKPQYVTCKGDEMFKKESIDKGIEINNEIVMKDKNENMGNIMIHQGLVDKDVFCSLFKMIDGSTSISYSGTQPIGENLSKMGMGKRKVRIEFDYFEDGKNEIENFEIYNAKALLDKCINGEESNKTEQDYKRVIAALRGEVTKKKNLLLAYKSMLQAKENEVVEQFCDSIKMEEFYKSRNIFQRIFNKLYKE